MHKYFPFIILFLLPFFSFSQFTEGMEALAGDRNPKHEDYQPLILEATTYIFNNPVDQSSEEFIAATQIVSFWMNKKTELNIPTFGDFFDSLSNENHQQFLYVIAMTHYGLVQKLNYGRVLKCEPVKRKTYARQEDVREVQLEGAKIFLEYAGNPSNNVPLNAASQNYLEAYNNGTIDRVFFTI